MPGRFLSIDSFSLQLFKNLIYEFEERHRGFEAGAKKMRMM